MTQQKINKMEAENKDNARFFSQQLTEAQDRTKALRVEIEELEKKHQQQKQVRYLAVLVASNDRGSGHKKRKT